MGWGKKLKDKAAGVVNTVIPRPGGEVGGVPARGVLVEIVQGPWHDRSGNHSRWYKVTLNVRLVEHGPSGAVTTVETYLGGGAWDDLQQGQEVPVRVDPTSGAVIGFDPEAHEAEVDERRRAPKPAAPSMDPDAAAITPIEGVTLELWASVQAGIAKGAIAPAGYDAFATSKGVPAGRWMAISSAWQARASTDWKVGSAFGAALQAEMQRP